MITTEEGEQVTAEGNMPGARPPTPGVYVNGIVKLIVAVPFIAVRRIKHSLKSEPLDSHFISHADGATPKTMSVGKFVWLTGPATLSDGPLITTF